MKADNLPILVGLVEDDPQALRRLQGALLRAPETKIAFAVSTAREARQMAGAAPRPDVLLVDLGLPDESGIHVIRHWRQTCPSTEIMVVSMFADETSMIGAIEAGAHGYILKDGTEQDLAKHVMNLHAGGSPMTPVIARRLLERLTPKMATASAVTEATDLTTREQEILSLLARGYTYGEVARLSSVSISTIQSHVKSIYGKLSVHSRSEAIFEARQLGIL